MVGDESQRAHAVTVLGGIEDFVVARLGAMSMTEKNKLVYELALVIDRLDGLSIDQRVQTGSDRVKASVIRARDRILGTTEEGFL